MSTTLSIALDAMLFGRNVADSVSAKPSKAYTLSLASVHLSVYNCDKRKPKSRGSSGVTKIDPAAVRERRLPPLA